MGVAVNFKMTKPRLNIILEPENWKCFVSAHLKKGSLISTALILYHQPYQESAMDLSP